MSNITTATFADGYTATHTDPLYQWDYGQILAIEGPVLPASYQVHFSNYERQGEAAIVLGDENGAAIPDELLQTGLDVFAFIYLNTGESDGETEYAIRIPVIKRPVPEEYEPTQEEQSIVTQLLGAVGSLGTEVNELKSDLTDIDERVEALEQGGSGGDGLTDAIKMALLTIADNVAYDDANGNTYYQALYDALYPPATLDRITAVYTQSGTVYDTASLDDLKPDLVVTAFFEDSTSRVLSASEYTLSGTLAEGTSTITVTYGGKTATFTVTVSVYSTSPTIMTEGVCWSKNAPNTVNKAGFGVTDWYDYEFTQEALEACQYWDATNEYMTQNGWSGCKVMVPDGYAYRQGNSWPSSANYKHVTGTDGVYTHQYSMTRNTLVSVQFQRNSVAQSKNNGISFSVPLADKEYAYAYWFKFAAGSIFPTGVTAGDIIFAGQQTPYYGLHNISEAPDLESIEATFTQGSTVVTTATTLAALKTMLTVDATYSNGRVLDVNPGVYTLTGELTEGTSTITVTYEGKTDTFDVVVSAA